MRYTVPEVPGCISKNPPRGSVYTYAVIGRRNLKAMRARAVEQREGWESEYRHAQAAAEEGTADEHGRETLGHGSPEAYARAQIARALAEADAIGPDDLGPLQAFCWSGKREHVEAHLKSYCSDAEWTVEARVVPCIPYIPPPKEPMPDTATAIPAGSIDMTPSWGEIGLLLLRLALSKEVNAVRHAGPEIARAFAMAEAYSAVFNDLTPEQRASGAGIIARERAIVARAYS